MLPTQIWTFKVLNLNRDRFSTFLTVKKFHNFSVIQILSVINYGESRSAEYAIFAILGALNCVKLGNISLQKVQKFIKNQNSEPLNLSKCQILRLWISLFWFHVKSEAEKSCNFHTVISCPKFDIVGNTGSSASACLVIFSPFFVRWCVVRGKKWITHYSNPFGGEKLGEILWCFISPLLN